MLPALKDKIMKFNRIVSLLILVLLIQSCAVQKLTKEGNSAYEAGNYEAALSNLEEVIKKIESKGEQAEGEVYFKAGMAAMELGKTEKASEYLEVAEYLEYPSPRLYTTLAKIYKDIDNLSKEIEALEGYHSNFPNGKKIDTINIRLFETYVESENWQKAANLWPDIESQAQSNIHLLAGYLTVNKNLENEEKADKLADQIVKKDPNNITALEWYAKKYFREAENLYVTEMNAYKKNRTNKQYKKLMDAWDKIWPAFRKSRDYFLKLYKLNPQPEYAKFLGNIYTRMDKKQKAEYWYKRAE